MKVYCLQDFKDELEKLTAKRAYSDLENEIIDYFFGKNAAQLLSGSRLNGSSLNPYIKKRLKGRGGYRVYYLLLISSDRLCLMFVHPKTGPNGADNITDQSKSKLYRKALNCINSNELFLVTAIGNRLEFTNPNKG